MGDMDLANKMIKGAAKSGIDACKLQATWSGNKMKSSAWDEDGFENIYKRTRLSDQDKYEKRNINLILNLDEYEMNTLENYQGL